MLAANLKQEITSAINDPYYHAFGGIPAPEDPLQWLIGNRTEKYQELFLDPDITSCFQKRIHAITAAEWEVLPGGSSKADEKAARLVKFILENLAFDRICLNLLEAIVVGFKVGEILWGQTEWEDPEDKKKINIIYPIDIRVRSSDRFTFVRPDKPTKNASLWGYELRFLTNAYSIYGEPLPDKKFIIYSVGSKTSNPFGVGLGSALYWPHQFKKQAVISALTFGDRFAQPTVIGKHLPEQNPKKLEQFVRSITEGTSGVIPDGMEVFLLEASRSSSQNFYEWLIKWCENQIKKVILSEMFTGVAQGLSGEPAQNDEKVRRELIKSDADMLHGCLNDTLFTWITEFNFKGAKPPKVWRVFAESEDLNARVNRDRTLQDMGFSLTYEKFTEVYGEGYKEPEDESLGGSIEKILGGESTAEPPQATKEPEPEAEPTPDEPATEEPTPDATTNENEFAEAFDLSDAMPNPLNPLVEATAQKLDRQIKDWVGAVRSLSEKVRENPGTDAQKFQEFQQGLLGLQKTLAIDEMAEAIAQSSLISEMGGRADVMDEIDLEELENA